VRSEPRWVPPRGSPGGPHAPGGGPSPSPRTPTGGRPQPPRTPTGGRQPPGSRPQARRERRSPSAGRALAGVAGISAIGTLLSRITGLTRTLLTAWALGANGVSDAYNVANTTPNIIYDLVLGGILAATLVPVFLELLNTPSADGGEEAGWYAISAVCSAILAVLVVVTVLFWLATPALIHLYTIANHSKQIGAERRLAVSLLYLFVPQFALYGITAVAAALLQAKRKYAGPMYTPILNNLVVIGALLAYATLVSATAPAVVHGNHTAVLLLGLGTTGGVAAMTVALFPFLSRAGIRLRLVWDPFHPAVRKMVRLAGWLFGVVVANQVALLVAILLSNHRTGDYSAYSYAYLFMTLPYGVWTVSVMSPMETEIAHAWQAGDREAARGHLVESIWVVMVVILPAALGMAVLARPAIQIVLEHGHLTAQGARATSDALIAMALGLPGYSLYLVFMRAFQAVQDTRSMFFIYLVENGLNIVLDLALYHRFGIRGLAAGLSIAYLGGAVVAAVYLSRRMGGIGGARLATGFGLVVVGAAFAAGAAWGISSGLAHLPGGHRQIGVALRVIVGAVAGVGVYLLAARGLGFDEMRRLLQLRRREQ
jgi:putative peptidoglycan lipid II flippase